MPDETLEPKTTGSAWRVEQVYGLAAVCLLVGVLVGYLFRDRNPLRHRRKLRLLSRHPERGSLAV